MRRVPEVIDCWFDSGAMPFAQWGYPHAGRESRFREQFPGRFHQRGDRSDPRLVLQPIGDQHAVVSAISELDRRRRLRPHTAFPHPFRNCIVLGLMLGEDGRRCRRASGTTASRSEIFDRYGADALRWYFFANQPPWTSIRYNEQAIKDSIPEFLLRLWNVYSFFVIYANIDGFDPAGGMLAGDVGRAATADDLARRKDYRPSASGSELDRWILSELNRTAAAVVERMDAYDNFAACGRITAFVDALSNWYVRRSRDRFWSEDKRSARQARRLLDALRMPADDRQTDRPVRAVSGRGACGRTWPWRPFGRRVRRERASVRFPTGDAAAIDEPLSERMNAGPRDRLARPRGPHGGQAQSAAAAGRRSK